MNKRILSFLLALFLIFDMIPKPTFATEGEVISEDTVIADDTENFEEIVDFQWEIEEEIPSTEEEIEDESEDPTQDIEPQGDSEVTAGAEDSEEIIDFEWEIEEQLPSEDIREEPEESEPETELEWEVGSQPLPENIDNCPWCEDTLAEDGTVIHAAYCMAAYAYDGTADIGRYVRLIPEIAAYGVDVIADPVERDSLLFYYDEFGPDTIMRITDWYWDGATSALWYQVELYSGAFPEGTEECAWPATPWILQNYTDTTYAWDEVLEFVPAEEIEGSTGICEICKNENCTALHFFCEICGIYDCTLPHLFCSACESYDCTLSHIWCGQCGAFDCGIVHEDAFRPLLEPVIPQEPDLPAEEETVYVVNEYGEPVTEEGYLLTEGRRYSLSAWNDLEDASYQWQIRYDEELDLWADIQGQTGQGILISPAMFKTILDEEGTAAIRCVMSAGGVTRFSAAIPVDVMEQFDVSTFVRNVSMAQNEEDSSALQEKAVIVVSYQYSDGRTAASSQIAEVIPGNSIDHKFDLPVIPGYEAILENAGTHASIVDGKVEVTFAEGELTAGSVEQIKVVYQPDYVKYTIIHYWQNVDDDRYTEHEREVIDIHDGNTSDDDRAHKTGDVITNVHKTYPGFYSLLYETPAAAADGSTVIEIYYDRYYYLMKFDLDGGYGVEPIYARYGADIEIGKPTKAGYEFSRWEPSVPDTMPVDGGTYRAVWTAATAQYTVSYWIVNDDGTRTLIGTHINKADVGSKVSGVDNLGTKEGYICNEESEHTHSAACYSCNAEAHSHTTACFEKIDPNKTNEPGDHGRSVIAAIGENEPESGYVYVVQVKDGMYWPKIYLDGNYYVIPGTDGTTDSAAFSGIIEGEPLGSATMEFTNETLIATKYKAKTDCGLEQHIHDTGCSLSCSQHEHDDDCYKDTTYLEYVAPDRTDVGDYKTETDVEVKGDGTSIVNVYYQYKEYTLKFYYAATTGGTVDDQDKDPNTYDSIKIVGGTTYYFGSNGPDTADDEQLLENEYWKYSGQWGGIAALPTLNDRGAARNYVLASVTYDYYGTAVTYHYISFKARYGDDISGMWPCDVFNSATRTDVSDNKNSWTGTEAFVSAWNGEYYVKYSQDHGPGKPNENQTIKGIYEKLDENLLFVRSYKEDYDEVSYLCFWENGCGGISWNTPKLFRYNIYLEAYAGQDLTGKTAVTKDGKIYYRLDSYDTCDNSSVHEQTQVALTGYEPVIFNSTLDGYENTEYVNYVRYDCFEYRKLKGTTDATLLQDDAYYNTSLYADGYDINFYYNANRHPLVFWNHDDFLMDGSGSQAAYNEPLTKHFDGIEINGVEYEGANDLVVKPEKYPKSLEPDAYEFEGWYLSPTFEPETKVVPANISMPNEPLRVYAKWVPVTHKVNYFLTRESLNRGDGETIPEEMARLVKEAGIQPDTDPYTTEFAETTVTHGEKIEGLGDPEVAEGYKDIHPYAGYDFVGWFYLNEDGEEMAFDPDNMPVNQNLNLYAKWSSDKLCQYNIYFVLDENGNGMRDENENTYIADPVSGNGIAGRTYTFTAKGGEDLFENYRAEYFPTVGSHSIIIDIKDTDGTAANSYTFLYQKRDAVPYTVKYLEEGTDKVLHAEKYVEKNQNVIVTENFVYVQGYMPDAYQKTLIVTNDNNLENDVIVFYYTKDEQHALYVVNYFIQDLNEDLTHKGWSKYTDLQYTGTIGETYHADAITIDGFTLSSDYTNKYNLAEKPINGMTGAALPTKPISALTDGELSGTLSNQGMELNFYYTRNLYPYEFRYMLNGTTTKLAEPTCGVAGYDTYVTEVAKPIEMDLDGDGIKEDFRLYDPTQNVKDIHIIVDGKPLSSTGQVAPGQATVNIATFYYTRCTQDMSITKQLEDSSGNADYSQEYTFSLEIKAKSGYHRNSYSFTKSDGEKGTLSPEAASLNILRFTLAEGETITIEDLPTAEYVLTELDLPTGYYLKDSLAERHKLTVNDKLDLTVTNIYAPAALEISKKVETESPTDNPEIKEFVIDIQVPEGVTGTFDYSLVGVKQTATVSDGKIQIKLQNGQTAVFENLPEGTYKVTEENYSEYGYEGNVNINNAGDVQGWEASVTLAQNTTQTVSFTNKYPTAHLEIRKTVTKEFSKQSWDGDTFTFTVRRTDRALLPDNHYDVYEGENKIGQATVNADGKLEVKLTFTSEEAKTLDAPDESLTRTLTIKNLPAGTYSVTEAENPDYRQEPKKVENLVLTKLATMQASFTNELIRPTGSLSLEKKLEKAEGYTGDLDENMEFKFTIQLMEEAPAEAKIYVNGASEPDTMIDGEFEFSVKAGSTVTITGLPVGQYRIVEATIPRYANKFAINGKDQDPKSLPDGQLYTEFVVEKGTQTDIQCTNTFPVDKAELIIEKQVTLENDLDTILDESFQFTVTLHVDADLTYSYQIYDQNGTEVGEEQTATPENQPITFELKHGQYAVIPDVPVCSYTVTEAENSKYTTSWEVYHSEMEKTRSTKASDSYSLEKSGSGVTCTWTLSADKTDRVVFTNEYKTVRRNLTIHRTQRSSDPDQVFVYQIQNKVRNETYTVTVTGDSSTTIYGLPKGTYTVTQLNGWSWRYDDSAKDVQIEDQDYTVTFDGSASNKWLDGNSKLKVNRRGEAGE